MQSLWAELEELRIALKELWAAWCKVLYLRQIVELVAKKMARKKEDKE